MRSENAFLVFFNFFVSLFSIYTYNNTLIIYTLIIYTLLLFCSMDSLISKKFPYFTHDNSCLLGSVLQSLVAQIKTFRYAWLANLRNLWCLYATMKHSHCDLMRYYQRIRLYGAFTKTYLCFAQFVQRLPFDILNNFPKGWGDWIWKKIHDFQWNQLILKVWPSKQIDSSPRQWQWSVQK